MRITFPSAIFKSALLWKIFQWSKDNRSDIVRMPRKRKATLAVLIGELPTNLLHFSAFIHRMVLAQTVLISPELQESPIKDVLEQGLSCFLFTKRFTRNSSKCGCACFGALGGSVCLCWTSPAAPLAQLLITTMFASDQLHHNYEMSRRDVGGNFRLNCRCMEAASPAAEQKGETGCCFSVTAAAALKNRAK